MDATTAVLRELRPDVVLVQGDTTTAMATALSPYIGYAATA